MRPKLKSLIDCFNELEASVSIITETWFATGQTLEIEAENVLLGSGISMITKNRAPLNGLSHGGVAVLAKDSSAKMKEYSFSNDESFEVLPVEAVFQGISRKFFIIAVYVPPGYTVARGRGCLEHVNDLVLDIKDKHIDPYICISGDFNQWKIEDHLADFPDLVEIITPPTRNERRIDRTFVNWPDHVHDCGCVPPLETEDDGDGVRMSDHKIQYALAKLPRRQAVKWKKIISRPFTSKGARKFKKDLERQDWSTVVRANGPNGKETAFQKIVDGLMDTHFPRKTSRRKDSDLPWIDEEAKKRCKKKKAVYKAEGKSPRWIAIRDNVENYLEKKRLSFLKRQRDNLTKPEAHKQFFRNVKDYKNAERTKSFDVRDLMPGLSDLEVAEHAADYFNEISKEFDPLLPHQVPTTYDKHVPYLSDTDVAGRLRKQKKPNSMVEGDVFPKLINDCADLLSIPLKMIYNEILCTKVWPIAWKREYVTIIPKKKLPEEMKDLRNISCTRFFSKVFETYVLENILEEIELKKNQYGGTKGCSTGHMLIEVWQQICDNAEDYRCATVLTAVDYSKAFNRLSFQHCMEAFRKKGASTTVIRLVSTFLTNRTMTVKAGNAWSSPREVNGGCPQGSILGVLLYNLTTDDLEDNFLEAERRRVEGIDAPIAPDERQVEEEEDVVETIVHSTPSKMSTPTEFADLSPVKHGFYSHDGQEIDFIVGSRNTPTIGIEEDSQISIHEELPVGTQNLTKKPVYIFKYVDDSVSCEKLNFATEPIQHTAEGPIKMKQAKGSQNGFKSVTRNALRKKMKVNEDKTNLLCISDSLSYVPKTYIEDNSGTRIDCSTTPKILGFEFSDKPTVSRHVDAVLKKFRQKYWSLRHLKRFGMDQKDLVLVYLSSIVPLADYCDYVYHSMLTDEQDERLENAQVGALRVIFGPKISGRRLREMANVKTLRSRRIEHTDNFARKAAASARFGHWFPKKTSRSSGRNPEQYKEQYARCDRLRNSPLYYMRRRLNGKPGKNYGERYRIYRET